MLSVYFSVGSWRGFKRVNRKQSVHFYMGWLSICLSTADFERLFEGVLKHDDDYRFVRGEYIMRIEDRLIQTLEELEESCKREAELELKVDVLEDELREE